MAQWDLGILASSGGGGGASYQLESLFPYGLGGGVATFGLTAYGYNDIPAISALQSGSVISFSGTLDGYGYDIDDIQFTVTWSYSYGGGTYELSATYTDPAADYWTGFAPAGPIFINIL